MLTLLADGDVLFVIRFGFGTGNVAHGVFFCLRSLNLFKANKSRERFITFGRINYVYSIYRYLSTDYYYMLCVFHSFRDSGFRVQGSKVEELNEGLKIAKSASRDKRRVS